MAATCFVKVIASCRGSSSLRQFSLCHTSLQSLFSRLPLLGGCFTTIPQLPSACPSEGLSLCEDIPKPQTGYFEAKPLDIQTQKPKSPKLPKPRSLLLPRNEGHAARMDQLLIFLQRRLKERAMSRSDFWAWVKGFEECGLYFGGSIYIFEASSIRLYRRSPT